MTLPTVTTTQANIAKVVGFIIAFLAVLHPGYHEPSWVAGAVGAAALLFVGGIQAYQLITKHVVTLTKVVTSKVATGSTATINVVNAMQVQQVIEVAVTAVVGIIALFHPGFQEPASVQSAIASISGVIVILIPFLNTIFKKKIAAVK